MRKVFKLLVVVLMVFVSVQHVEAATKKRLIYISKISGSTIYYRYARGFYDYDYENNISNDMGDWGYGKLYKIKATSSTKYYLFNNNYVLKKTTRKKVASYAKYIRNLGGKNNTDYLYTYSTHKRMKAYYGLIMKMTYKGKKAVKLVETYEP